VLSFWPYEEEAMRTVWECLRIGRTMEKALRSNADEIEAMRGEVTSLQAALRDKEQQLQYGLHQAQRAIASRNAVIAQRTSQLRTQHVAHQRQVRDLRGQVNMARRKATVARSEARSQRLRLRDPILVYVLQGGRDGFDRDDWALVCPTVLCCR
jgi:chromosome segregation ATPase